METYNFEFTYFDAAEWNDVDVKIIALSMYSLMRSFVKVTEHAHEFAKTPKEYRRYIWESNQKYIEKKKLEFPIITTSL